MTAREGAKVICGDEPVRKCIIQRTPRGGAMPLQVKPEIV